MSNQQNYESEHHNSLVDYSHVDPSTEACNKLYLEDFPLKSLWIEEMFNFYNSF